MKILLQVIYLHGIGRDVTEAVSNLHIAVDHRQKINRSVYDDTIDLFQLLIDSKKGLKNLLSLVCEYGNNAMVYEVFMHVWISL